ncbi:MAG: (2Fe-2S)-binding protein [Bdellovibrionaceae bacterium]|nr:(2Fe-2S)-binding protein [Pseudobdellovibrionaceae bacterium]
MQSAKKLSVEIEGRDQITWESLGEQNKVTFVGCFEFTQLVKNYRTHFGNDVFKWPLPNGSTHSEMIIREFILKLKGRWEYPYKDEEICHCRHVKTKTVDNAVLNGAHTHELASRWTGCSTACGTCKPDVEKVIKYRVG